MLKIDNTGAGKLDIGSVALTEISTGVTPPANDSSTKLATTEFVETNTTTRINEAFGRLVFFIDGEHGNDNNSGTSVTTPFQSFVGLKRRIENGLVVAASAGRDAYEEVSGSGRTEAQQFWTLSFKSGVDIYLRNTTDADVVQTYSMYYAIYSTVGISIIGYSDNNSDFRDCQYWIWWDMHCTTP
jgi:hypothetical protein